MALSSEVRRSERYKGDGSTVSFPFGFKVFEASHVYVLTSVDDLTEEAVSPSLYSVSLNSDQDNNPGGTITLAEALPKGKSLVVASCVPYLQPAVYTNRGGFYPEHLNKSYDLLTMQTQQLNEKLGRALMVPATSTKTPDELTNDLMAAQDEAKRFAEEAGAHAEAAKASEEKAAEYAESATIVAPIADAVQAVAGNVSDVKTVSEGIFDVVSVSANMDTVQNVSEHAEHIYAVNENIGVIHTVYEDLPDIDTVAGISEHVTRTSDISGQVLSVSENMDSVRGVSSAIDDVRTVAADLITEINESGDEDYGWVDDPDSSEIRVTGGSIVAVASAIGEVRAVAENIEAVKAADENARIASESAAIASEAAESASTDSLLAHDWAVKTDGLVADEDYSSKWYAAKAQEAAASAIEAADSATFQMVEQMAAFYNAYYDADLDYRDYLDEPKSELLADFYGFCEGYEGVTDV